MPIRVPQFTLSEDLWFKFARCEDLWLSEAVMGRQFRAALCNSVKTYGLIANGLMV